MQEGSLCWLSLPGGPEVSHPQAAFAAFQCRQKAEACAPGLLRCARERQRSQATPRRTGTPGTLQEVCSPHPARQGSPWDWGRRHPYSRGGARTDASPAHVKRWPLGRVACPWGVECTSVREGEVTGTCIACCLKTLETNPVLLWGETTSSNRSSHVLGLDSTFLQGREHQAKHKRTRKIPPNSAASLKVTQQQNRKFQRTHRACV